MENTKRRAAVKILILGPYLILLYILQSTVFTHIELFGAKPMLTRLIFGRENIKKANCRKTERRTEKIWNAYR